jgi:hypothetical protein
MAQRLTASRQIFWGMESTEGVDPGNETGSSALAVSNLVLWPDVSFYRRSVVGQMGSISGNVGAQTSPMLMFTCDVKGQGTDTNPELDPLLQVVLATPTDHRTFSDSVSASTNNTTFTMTTGVSGLSVGDGIALEVQNGTGTYEIGWIQSIDVGNQQFTLAAPLAHTIANGAAVKGALTYSPKNTGHSSLTLRVNLETGTSPARIDFFGCKGSVKLDMPAPGVPARATFYFQAMSWAFASSTLTPTYHSATPPSPYLFKIGGISADVKLVSWDLRQRIARKLSQSPQGATSATVSQLVTNRDLVGVFQGYDVDNTQFTEWSAGTTTEIGQQFGSTVHDTVAYQIGQAQRGYVAYGDDNGLTTDIVAFQGAIANGADELRMAFL